MSHHKDVRPGLIRNCLGCLFLGIYFVQHPYVQSVAAVFDCVHKYMYSQ